MGIFFSKGDFELSLRGFSGSKAEVLLGIVYRITYFQLLNYKPTAAVKFQKSAYTVKFPWNWP